MVVMIMAFFVVAEASAKPGFEYSQAGQSVKNWHFHNTEGIYITRFKINHQLCDTYAGVSRLIG